MRRMSVEAVVMGRRMGRRGRSRVALLLLLGVCLAPSLAAANSYHDFLCRIPYGPQAGRAAPADDVTYATNGGFFYAGDGCEGGGALYAAMDGEVTHLYGTSASNTFTAPTGLTIAGFTIWRYESDAASKPYGSPASNLLYSPGPPSVQGLCAEIEGCPYRGSQANPFDPSNVVTVGDHLSGVTLIQWSAACGGGPGGECPASGGPGSGSLSSQYDVYAADIDLVDNTPPTVGGVSGPLVAGGTLSGQQAISFNAADGQSGVYGGSLLVDGHTVVSRIFDTNEGACQSLGVTSDGQRSFEHAQPCKASVSAVLMLNTSQFTPGAHSLELIIDDAAGNQAVGYNGTITVGGSSSTGSSMGSTTDSATASTIGPGSPLAVRGPGNGANASDEAMLNAHWTRTRKVTFTSRYGATDQITGRLTNAAGQGISGAVLDVYETPAYEGARTVPLAGMRTDPTGGWTLSLPRGVSSSALRLQYRSHVNDTVLVATAMLTLRVYAGIALRIAPRVASVGRSIHFNDVSAPGFRR